MQLKFLEILPNNYWLLSDLDFFTPISKTLNKNLLQQLVNDLIVILNPLLTVIITRLSIAN